jgi:GNAT superfamily N-acetyltransferase
VSANEALVRLARIDDLSRIWDIRFRNDVAGEANPPIQGPTPAYLSHLLETADICVAERDGMVVAYAAASERGGIIYLNDLFVDPCAQSGKLGNALLQAVLPNDGAPRCVLASTDFRAIALYTRFGMAPLWPNIELEAASSAISLDVDASVDLIEADAADPELVAWDAAIGGRSRAVDIRFWQECEQGVFFWCRSAGRTIGYAAALFAAARNWHPEAVVIGPVGARDPLDAARCLFAIVEWAARRAPFVQVAVPGPHPGLVGLLKGGMRIGYVETYGATDDRIVDPARYVGSGGDLF